MSLSAEKLAALLASIQALTTALKAQLDTKLDATAQAVDSAKLDGKTLAEITSDLNAASADDLAALQTLVETFNARTDNPHAVTKAQVELGNVDNFATASDAEAVTATAADKFITPKNLGAFWADKVGAAPGTLDTIAEIAAALQNNPDVITALQTLVQDNADAIEALATTVDGKLDATAQAADSAKLGGKTLAELEAEIASAGDGSATLAAAKQYTDEQVSTKLDATAQATDSAKLNGKTEEQLNTARDAAIDDKVAAATGPLDTRISALEDAVGGGSDFLTATSDLGANPVALDSDGEDPAKTLKVHLEGLNTDVDAASAAAATADGKAVAAQTAADNAGTAAATADGKAVAAQTAADAAQADATSALAGLDDKLDKAAAASNADVTTGTATDKYVTPAALKSKTDAQDLAIAANATAIDDLVDQLTTAFNDAADDIEGTEPA